MNIRKAICAGSIVQFTLVSLDVFTLPIAEYALQQLQAFDFFTYRFKFSLPTRIIQILLLGLIYGFDISIADSPILCEDWKKLSSAKRITTTMLISMLVATILFETNYIDLFFKQLQFKEWYSSLNMTIFLVETILFMIITLILFNRTTSYEYYKQILSKKPTDVFQMMLDKSNILEVRTYEKMLAEHFDKIKREGVEINER